MGAPSRREGAAALTDWLDVRSDELFLSTVTVTEIGDGIAKLRRSGGLVRADRLDDTRHGCPAGIHLMPESASRKRCSSDAMGPGLSSTGARSTIEAIHSMSLAYSASRRS